MLNFSRICIAVLGLSAVCLSAPSIVSATPEAGSSVLLHDFQSELSVLKHEVSELRQLLLHSNAVAADADSIDADADADADADIDSADAQTSCPEQYECLDQLQFRAFSLRFGSKKIGTENAVYVLFSNHADCPSGYHCILKEDKEKYGHLLLTLEAAREQKKNKKDKADRFPPRHIAAAATRGLLSGYDDRRASEACPHGLVCVSSGEAYEIKRANKYGLAQKGKPKAPAFQVVFNHKQNCPRRYYCSANTEDAEMLINIVKKSRQPENNEECEGKDGMPVRCMPDKEMVKSMIQSIQRKYQEAAKL